MEGYKLRRWIAVGFALFWLGVGAMLLRADSPIGSTIQGGYKMCNFWASSDTLYTPENMTAYFAAGDPIKIWSPANGADPINGVISAENAAYMVLADTLSFLVDDTEAYFEHANRVTVNDPDGKTIRWVDPSTGDMYWLDDSGDTALFFDASANAITMNELRFDNANYVVYKDGSGNIFFDIAAGFKVQMDFDKASGNSFDFINSASLTDTNGKQAGLRIVPKFNQSGTASGDGLLIDNTWTSVGDGSTGAGNNAFRIVNDGVSDFGVSKDGVVSVIDTLKVIPNFASTIADSSTFITRTANGNPRIGMTDAAGNLMTITASGDSMYFEGASAYYFDVAPTNP